MGFSERRAQRRWERDMDQRMRELDREYGGRTPSLRAVSDTAGPAAGRHRQRRRRGPVLPGLLVVLVVLALLLIQDPSGSTSRIRELVGMGNQRLEELVGVSERGGSFAFAQTQPVGDEPVSWDPCRAIRYVVNPDGAPDGWEELVTESVAAISEATGFRFRDEGLTEERSFESRGRVLGAHQPVLIGWADAEEVPGLAGDVAGLGGSAYVEADGHRRYVTGMVVLDTATYDALARRYRGEEDMRAILTHELGHVVGLGHVDDRGELMYEQNLGRTEFGPGDLEGLARLGSVPCS